MIKGCNIFWGSKIGKHLQRFGRAHYRATRKNLDSRTQLEEPAECASGGDSLILYKIPHLMFFFVHCVLRVGKNLSTVLMQYLWNFSFFGRGDVSPTHSELCCFVSGSLVKHQISSPVIILLKVFVCIGYRADVLARRDLIFLLLRCQGVPNKSCTRLSLSQILFHNPKKYSLGDVQRFCYHF